MTDFINVLCLKNQLLNVDEEKLMEVYQDYNNYMTFLDSVVVLTQIDSAFLLYKDMFSKKIEQIIGIHRYNTKDSNVRAVINDIIGYLNSIKTYSPNYRNLLKDSYKSYHENVRKTYFKNSDELLYSMGYDAVVYAAITEDDMNLINQDDMFLSSINYLLETIPSIFDDPKVRERTLKKIDKLEKWAPFNKEIRKYSRVTKANYQKIKNKEE